MKPRTVIWLGLMCATLVLAAPIFTRLAELGARSPGARTATPGEQAQSRLDAVLERARDRHRDAGGSAPTPAAGPRGGQTRETRVTVYRWVDRNGTVHYESGPPPAGVRAEEIVFERRRPAGGGNGPARGRTREAPPEAPARAPTGIADNPARVYTPDGFEELMETLDETLGRLGERQAELEEIKDAL